MSRLWSKLFGREHEEAVEAAPATAPAETVELKAAEPEPEPLAPPEVAPQPEPEPEPEPEPQAVVEDRADGPLTAADVEARLGELLESLGSAHRRPFVRNG